MAHPVYSDLKVFLSIFFFLSSTRVVLLMLFQDKKTHYTSPRKLKKEMRFHL